MKWIYWLLLAAPWALACSVFEFSQPETPSAELPDGVPAVEALAGSSAAAVQAVGVPCEDPRMKLLLEAADTVNLAPDGSGQPVSVRIFQLRRASSLRSASHEQVLRSAEEVLGDDLLDVQETIVYPASARPVELELTPESRVIAVVASFREPRGQDWRVLLRIDPQGAAAAGCDEGTKPLVLSLDRTKIMETTHAR